MKNIGLAEIAINAAEAAGRAVFTFASGGKVIVESDLQETRLAICNKCDEFTGARCNRCGCFTIAKTKLATEKCPLGRW